MDSPPNYPVIVVHADDGNGLTACTGQPMPGPVGDVYRNVPRYFCQACDPTTSNAASRQMAEADVVELARSLPGAEERVRPNGQRILVIELEPAPEPFLPLDLMDSPPKEDE